MVLPVVSESELKILQLLWDRGKLTVRQITQVLYPEQSTSDVATVQKMVHRLEQKGLIAKDRSAFVHTIEALIDRDAFAAQRLTETATKLARGTLKPLLAHLLESDQLTNEELDEIRKLIDKHRKKRRLEGRDDNATA